MAWMPTPQRARLTQFAAQACNLKPLLTASGLSLQLPGGQILRELNFEIPAGISLVKGGEGSGKTSLLRVLAGKIAPISGALCHGTSSVFWADPKSEAFDALTYRQYFELLVQQHPAFDITIAMDLAGILSLDDHLNKTLGMLSTGSKRKVWLAAGFASKATITLMDMPFAALDARSVNTVCRLLEEASTHPTRAWVLADYEPPAGVTLAGVIDLGD